jgi:beta-glucanase (GH16 family)
VPIDAREFHVYAAEWTPEHVTFSIDGEHIRTVGLPDNAAGGVIITGAYPKEFVVDYVRGYRRVPG